MRTFKEAYSVNDLEDVSNAVGRGKTGRLGEWAVVEKDGEMVKLINTFNYDAVDPIQLETYSDKGWYYFAADLTEENFWDVWVEWNDIMSGGIELEDGLTEDEVQDIIDANKKVSVRDLDRVPDGVYSVQV